MAEKLDIMAVGAHPDDVEISAGGTVAKSVALGQKVGIVDLTRGELGSRGSAELRNTESARASEVLGISIRENLEMADGFFQYNEENLRSIIRVIRKYRPEVVICTAPSDRHPDHGRSSKLIQDACFFSGLIKIETTDNGASQACWRPKAVYSYIQDHYLKPDFVIDISDFWEKKVEALKCYSSQFYSSDASQPQTPISGKEFFDYLYGRALQMGRPAGYVLGEGFIAHRTPGVSDLLMLK
jgi:bacillithiol biosynthesis deacetylase BshB1